MDARCDHGCGPPRDDDDATDAKFVLLKDPVEFRALLPRDILLAVEGLLDVLVTEPGR